MTTAYERRCDGSGRFRIELPRTSSARHDALTVTALAPGYGLGWAELDPDAESPTADVALRPEQVIRGRLFDLQGQPARGVRIAVQRARHVVRGELAAIARPDAFERPWLDSPAWPASAISDDEGRFTLRGLGRGPNYSLSTDDPRFSLQPATIRTDDGAALQGRLSRFVGSGVRVEPGPDPKPITITVQPARTLTGRVTDADTGRPVPHALVAVGVAVFRGRWRRAVPRPGPAVGSPQSVRHPRRVSRRRTVPGRREGRRMAQGGPRAVGRPGPDPGRGGPGQGGRGGHGPARRRGGRAHRAVPLAPADRRGLVRRRGDRIGRHLSRRRAPGPGYLVVQGSDEYVLREFGGDGDGALIESGPGHRRFYAHAYRAVDLKPDGPDQEIDITLRRGTTIRGRVVGPDGRPVPDARVFSRIILRTIPRGGWKEFYVAPTGGGRGQVRDGRFTLHGLDADVEVPVFFLEPERKLGATVRFSGRSAIGRAGHRPARALRHGEGAAGRSRRQAARSISRRELDDDDRHARAACTGGNRRRTIRCSPTRAPCPSSTR